MTSLVGALLSAIDDGAFADPNETRMHIERGDVREWLAATFPHHFNASAGTEPERLDIVMVLQDHSQEDRGGKFGPTNNGLLIMAAYLNHRVGRGSNW